MPSGTAFFLSTGALRKERDTGATVSSKTLNRPIRRLLVANRSEIAIRIFRAATELRIRTFTVYAKEDRLSLHRFKADEAYQIGKGKGALEAYLSIDEIIGIATDHKIDARAHGAATGSLPTPVPFIMRVQHAP